MITNLKFLIKKILKDLRKLSNYLHAYDQNLLSKSLESYRKQNSDDIEDRSTNELEYISVI